MAAGCSSVGSPRTRAVRETDHTPGPAAARPLAIPAGVDEVPLNMNAKSRVPSDDRASAGSVAASRVSMECTTMLPPGGEAALIARQP